MEESQAHFWKRITIEDAGWDEDNILHVELNFPPYKDQESDNPKGIQIGLNHVRAANDIRITYDLDRDGWVISMEKTKDMGDYSIITVGSLEEMAFVPAWNEERSLRAPQEEKE